MSGRLFAYAGVGVGLSISVAANAMHAQADPRAPWWGPYLAAAWPLLLFLALEVLTRTVWADGRGVEVARVGVTVVAAVSATLSYWHLRGLLVTAGEDFWAAMLGPLAIDGLMAVSAAALLNEDAPVAAEALAPVALPEPVPAETEPAVSAVPVEETSVRAETVAPQPDPAPAPVSRPRRPVAPEIPAAVTDEALLARIGAAVASGELAASDVTANRLRSLLGVGAARAARLAEAWHEQHRRAAVAVAP